MPPPPPSPSPAAETEATWLRALLERADAIARYLASRFSPLTADQVTAECTDALLDLLSLQANNRIAGPVSGLLSLACRRRVGALARRERARQARECNWAAAEGKAVTVPETEPDRLERLAELVILIETVLPDDMMRTTFRLWLGGERSSQVYATALGLAEGLGQDRQRTVERLRNRLAQFLRRNATVRAAARRLLRD